MLHSPGSLCVGVLLSVSISIGEVYYDGFSSFSSIVFDTILFHCFLLPSSVAAAWLRHRERPEQVGEPDLNSRGA